MNNYEPGELIFVGGNYGNQIGFYRGPGQNTIQYYTPRSIVYCNKQNRKPWASLYWWSV